MSLRDKELPSDAGSEVPYYPIRYKPTIRTSKLFRHMRFFYLSREPIGRPKAKRHKPRDLTTKMLTSFRFLGCESKNPRAQHTQRKLKAIWKHPKQPKQLTTNKHHSIAIKRVWVSLYNALYTGEGRGALVCVRAESIHQNAHHFST